MQIITIVISTVTLLVVLIRWCLESHAEKPNLSIKKLNIEQLVHLQGGQKEVGVEGYFIIRNYSKLNNSIIKTVVKFGDKERILEGLCKTISAKTSETFHAHAHFVFPNTPLPKECPVEFIFIDTHDKTYQYSEIIKVKDTD